MTKPTFRQLPTVGHRGEHDRRIVEVVNNILAGKLNATGEFTLPDTQSTIIVDDPRASIYSEVHLVAKNAAAAALNWWITPGTQQFTVTTTAAAVGDALFGYTVIG